MEGNFKAYPSDARYEVSDQGYVKNVKTGEITRGHLNDRGYYVFSLTKNKVKRVGRMVLETFVGPCPNGCECSHKNTVKTDNRLENLEWSSPDDNQHNPLTLRKRWRTKGGIIYIFCVGNKIVKITESYRAMGRYLGLSDTTAYRRIRNGASNVNGGRVFKVNTIK